MFSLKKGCISDEPMAKKNPPDSSGELMFLLGNQCTTKT